MHPAPLRRVAIASQHPQTEKRLNVAQQLTRVDHVSKVNAYTIRRVRTSNGRRNGLVASGTCNTVRLITEMAGSTVRPREVITPAEPRRQVLAGPVDLLLQLGSTARR